MADLDPRIIDLIHATTDLHTDLCRHRRVMMDAAEVLTLALHALRHGSPEVTDEYLDRTITALDRATDPARLVSR